MLQAISSSITGLQANQDWIDIIANNLANLNTTSYKRNQVDFADLLYVTQLAPGGFTAQGLVAPTGLQVGMGVTIADSSKVFAQGALTATGGELDVAIQGDGFFRVTGPDGTVQYTRDGAFQLDSSGTLRTSGGLALLPTISIPSDTTSIQISTDGTVRVLRESAPNTLQTVGQLSIASFINPGGLESEGNNVYSETVGSGTPLVSVAGQNGHGTIEQGFLEASNVDQVTELVNLILAQNGVTYNSEAITVANDMIQATLDLIA